MAYAKEYKKYYKDIGLPEHIYSKYLEYILRMDERNLPPIFDINHLSLLLGKSRSYLASAINASEYHYREFEIKKRKGGKRKISAPYPALYECQKWINQEILSKITVHKCAHGFVRNRSIMTNAKVHKNADVLLKLDIEDFFPSVSKGDVIALFRRLGYPRNISTYLASLCCLDGALPQGGACSPTISNLVCMRLDSRLAGLAKKYSLFYSRYADDMVFSGKKISSKLIDYASSIISDEGFKVNTSKTKLVKSNTKIITGIRVSEGRIFLPKKYKNKLRQEVHYVTKFGYYSHISKKKINDPFYLDRLLGKLSFWMQVEPDAAFPREKIDHILKTREYYGFDPDQVA